MRMIRSAFLVTLVLAASLFTGCAAEDDSFPEASYSEELQEQAPAQAPESGEAPVTPAASLAAPALFCRTHLDCYRGSATNHFCCNNRCVRPVPGLICVDHRGEGSSE